MNHKWDESIQGYDNVPTQYFSGPCDEVFEQDILSDAQSQLTSFNTQQFRNLNYNSFVCPKKLLPDFVGGIMGDDDYITTHFELFKCDSTLEPTIGYECQESSVIEAMISELTIEFLYLESNF